MATHVYHVCVCTKIMIVVKFDLQCPDFLRLCMSCKIAPKSLVLSCIVLPFLFIKSDGYYVYGI